jgi:hypothetical protein
VRTSEKLDYLLSDIVGALFVLRDIDPEHDGENDRAETAWRDAIAATAGGKALEDPRERATVAPLITAWRTLFDAGKDVDDGKDLAAWLAEIAPLVEALPRRQFVVAAGGIDTSHTPF